MVNALRPAGMLLMLVLAVGVSAVGQSSSGAEPASDKRPSSASEPKTGDHPPVYRVGGDVSAPKPTYSPEPEYSKEARKAKYQGTCALSLIVGEDGNPRDIKVTRILGKGLDEKAVEAVKKWKFEPARKDGQPVAVQVNVFVTFKLY
jgi:TonB family protein